MKTQNNISQQRINRIKEQGYFNYSNYEITQIAFGNRFAYILCTCILVYAVITANIPILTAMLFVAFGGVVLPNHPFDYIYNHILRFPLRKPKLPKRSKQLKFACSIATSFIAITIFLFDSNLMTAGYIVGANLLFSAILVSTTDICIPSVVYNRMLIKKGKNATS
jgi:hypothetical protein